MRRLPNLLALAAALTACLAPGLAAAKGGPQVWMSAVDDLPAPKGFVVDQDYLQLFKADAPWKTARSHLTGFQMTRRYILSKDEATLRPVFEFLKTNDLTLAVTFGMIPSKDGCGPNVEGMVHHPTQNLLTARRLKAYGAERIAIDIDEALTFGHYFALRPAGQKQQACDYDIETLAGLVAEEIKKVRSVYPDAEIIDTEANSGIGTPDELREWLDALHRDLGDRSPITVQFDVQWNSPTKPWQTNLPPLIQAVVRHGDRYGVIFDGTPQDATDQAWVRTAQDHIQAFEATVQRAPDNVMIQSWNPHPTRLLPETSPTTLPYLVNWYCEHSTQARGCR